MNNHIFQTLFNWNNLSENKNFRNDFMNNHVVKKEIEKLKQPVSHIEAFANMSFFFYIGIISTQFVLFLLRKTNLFSAILAVSITTIGLILVYIWKYQIKKRKNQLIITKNQEILDSYTNQFNQDLYNLNNFELMDDEYKKYCINYGLEKQYNSFKFGLVNQKLENLQIIAFYDFMEFYCKENINKIPISNIQVKTANSSNNDISFFS